jgi:nucleotide-binding universal stress UspA family protein
MRDNRAMPDRGGTIVVGVDGSDPSRKAVHWALSEAAMRGGKLVAVHAWSYYPSLPSDSLDPMLMTPDFNETLGRDADRFVQHEVERLRTDAGAEHVEIEARAVEGPAASVLVEVAKDADLLVLGTRGHGGFSGLLLGSVSQQVSHHAPCPLVLVPHE